MYSFWDVPYIYLVLIYIVNSWVTCNFKLILRKTSKEKGKNSFHCFKFIIYTYDNKPKFKNNQKRETLYFKNSKDLAYESVYN